MPRDDALHDEQSVPLPRPSAADAPSQPVEYRVFLSSPNDVKEERALARRVIDRLNGEYAEHVCVRLVDWEDKTYSATKDFQAQIKEASSCDLVVGILWARTGTPLNAALYARPDGRPYESGTVFEIETA